MVLKEFVYSDTSTFRTAGKRKTLSCVVKRDFATTGVIQH
jgi:hypothetical protein